MRKMRFPVIGLAILGQLCNGCSLNRDTLTVQDTCFKAPLDPSSCPPELRPSEPCLSSPCETFPIETFSPLDLTESSLSPDATIPLTLEQAIQYALSNSRVIRDIGGALLRSPQSIVSTYDPAAVYTDPRVGEEAALSAFDANLTGGLLFEKNDRLLNNAFFGNQGVFQQDLHTYQWGVNKRSATGDIINFRHITVYDNNNQQSNRLGPSTFDTYMEGEVRHPLLQGSGTQFNRIAGPGATPGQINGVLISRIRTDISLADFERSVRDLVADVENSYWDLYYAYRDLEAKITARDIAAREVATLQAKASSDMLAADGNLAQAREQELRFQADIVDALNGRPLDGTRTYNGSTGGTFRGIGGLRTTERRLRLMIGMPINDGLLIRTVDSPSNAPIAYDWNTAIGQATTRRAELRRQRWVIKQRELELIANRNFLKPQLDVIARYRFRGFGDHLVANGDFSNAASSLLSGDLQEWQMGVEYSMPVGFRKAHAAVRNSQLTLAREIELLREQERLVTFGLSNAFSEMRRSYDNMQLQEGRLDAIVMQLNSFERRKSAGDNAPLDVLLETHRRLLDARLRYHQAHIEYALANRNVHVEKGTLLEYCSITLAESITAGKAYQDAVGLKTRRSAPFEPATRDVTVSNGPAS